MSSDKQSQNPSNSIPIDRPQVISLVRDLFTNKRSEALQQLVKTRNQIPDLGVLLWYTPGLITTFLQDILQVYPFLSPPNLPADLSNHICNVLTLCQCIAGHERTRLSFIQGNFYINLP